MTNEELKKKIIEIVLDTKIRGIKIRNITGGISMAKTIAEALIAAGIGDVSELKELKIELRDKVDYIHEQDEIIKEYKRRVKEPKEFTDEEKEYARLNDKISYYARDKNGLLYGYFDKPVKGVYTWKSSLERFIRFIHVCENTSLSFSSIKWEDPEPTSRDEIINS